MLPIDAVCLEVSVARVDLADWIARGWVEPAGEPPDWQFAPGDVARARLVRDLRVDAGIETETLAMVLSLLDQMHAMQATVAALLDGLDAQPEAVRRAILDHLRRSLP